MWERCLLQLAATLFLCDCFVSSDESVSSTEWAVLVQEQQVASAAEIAQVVARPQVVVAVYEPSLEGTHQDEPCHGYFGASDALLHRRVAEYLCHQGQRGCVVRGQDSLHPRQLQHQPLLVQALVHQAHL